MGNKSWYLTEVESKFFKSVGAGGKSSKGGNGMLWDGSDKIFALKVSNNLWSHCSWISHLGSSTAFPVWYGFFRNCWLAFFIFHRLFLLDSLQWRIWSLVRTFSSKVCKESLVHWSEVLLILASKSFFSVTTLMECWGLLLWPLGDYSFLWRSPKSREPWS